MGLLYRHWRCYTFSSVFPGITQRGINFSDIFSVNAIISTASIECYYRISYKPSIEEALRDSNQSSVYVKVRL